MILNLLFLVHFTSAQVSNKLLYRFGNAYELVWNDKGSGAKRDASFWTPVSSENGFYPLGDTVVENHAHPQYSSITVKDSGDGNVALPSSFSQIWNDAGSGAKADVAIYKMNPPAGYTCLGHVTVASHATLPDLYKYRCVKTEFTTVGMFLKSWDDVGSGAYRDVSLWTVVSNPSNAGLTAGTFISSPNYGTPAETPLVLNYRNTLASYLAESQTNISLVIYESSIQNEIWNDKGSGARVDLSIWRSRSCCNLGDVAVARHSQPTNVLFAKEIKPGTLVLPDEFLPIWNDRGSGAKRDVSIWRPLCPQGYQAIGYVSSPNHGKPSRDSIYCVHQDCVIRGSWSFIWNDKGSGATDDVSIWQANPINKDSQGFYAMSAVRRHGDMDVDAFVLKKSCIQVYNSPPAIKIEIKNVQYDISQQALQDAGSVSMKTITLINCAGKSPLQSTGDEAFSRQETVTWRIETSIQIGVSVEFSAGIPLLGEIETTVSLTTTVSAGKEFQYTDTIQGSVSGQYSVSPRSRAKLSIVGRRFTTDIPWKARMITYYEGGKQQEDEVRGIFKGVNLKDYVIQVDSEEYCGDEPSSRVSSSQSEYLCPSAKEETNCPRFLKNESVPCVRIRDDCYCFNTIKMNWTDAAQFCAKHNMSLVTLQTAQKENLIRGLVPLLDLPANSYWYSGSDQKLVAKWTATGKPNNNYTNLHKDQLDIWQGNQDCLVFSVNHLPSVESLDDKNCKLLRNSVCEA